MRENLSGKIELSLFDPSTITLAVRHMYGERINELTDSQGFDLYRFSHQFEVVGLSELSRHHILTSMNCTTCIDILNFGFFFDDVELKEHSSVFITEHFSELASEDHTLANLCSLSPALFFSFIESDSLCATELEAFLVGMKWLSCHEGAASIMDIVRRIRWNIMQPDMFQTALHSPMVLRFPSLRKFLRSSRMTISMHLNGNTPHRRRLCGRPTAIVSIPVVQRPPRAALHICQRSSDDLLGPQEYRTNYKRNRVSNMVDKLFQYKGLSWSCRAELGECQAKGCSQPRLSVSLWLEQNELGLVSTDKLQTARKFDSFPIRVKTRYLVWNSMGGQLHKGIVDFMFRSSGWASGWCVQDVLGGHTQSDRFFQRLSSLEGTTDVVHVAIEILNCENG
ncbi:Kelch-like protein 41a [Gracilariopsis chorda]|uniref:Kelch-like protein 41a n=1 Tax=Gracilariopsis chorda TaxID=448386 RepID=A0A2V3IVE9_9FLOR|nr:Kelch-like protein 41a [Gracilariopsis chorda]|eukprot:PXF46118.1 Kelch-like protein 41a [Gracilariopsis chorda]